MNIYFKSNNKVILFAAVFFFLMVRSVSAANCGGSITCNCGDTLTSSYTMNSDLTNCPGNGINIDASSIILDCQGHTLTGTNSGYGIYLTGSGNVIKNCIVTSFYYGIELYGNSNNQLTGITANSNAVGIYLNSSSNNNLTDITVSFSAYEGIHLASNSNNKLTNITVNFNHFHGIYLSSSSNNQLTNITAYSNQYGGIYSFSNSNNNTLTGITASSNEDGISISHGSNSILTNITANSNRHGGINIDTSSNNKLTGITANSNVYGILLAVISNFQLTGITTNSNNYGIFLFSSSNNNIFRDGSISSSTAYDVYLQLTDVNNTFTNVSYNTSKENVENGSQLIRKWYYRAFANDNLGNNVSNANITAYNRTGDYSFNLTTDSSGYTQLGEIIDYVNNGTRTYPSNYTIYASKPSYRIESHNVNASLGNNYKDTFTLFTTDVSSCGNLGLANAIYTLQSNISTTGTCFNILANNVTLDLNGFSIRGNDTAVTNYGVYVSGYNYTTIKNGGVYDFMYGIYLNMSSNNTLTSITANSNKDGIYLSSSSSNNLANINANSNSGYGIILVETAYTYSPPNNNQLTSITANSNYAGIELASGSNNTLTSITANSNNDYGINLNVNSNNKLTNITANSNANGISLYGSSNNTLTGITANSNGYGIYSFGGSNNNIFKDGSISSTALDVYLSLLSTYNNTNNTFTNMSYNTSKENVENGSQLIRKWYYRAFANDNLGNNVSNANITAYNRTGDYSFNLTTDSTGYTSLAEITEYINNGGTRTYSSNYTVYAAKPMYQTQNHSFNASLGNNYKDVFTLFTVIMITSPVNGGAYYSTTIPLNFSANVPTSWCGYSLDGAPSITLPNCINTTLTVSSYGSHNVTVYASDTSGNMGSSRVYFDTYKSGHGGGGCGAPKGGGGCYLL